MDVTLFQKFSELRLIRRCHRINSSDPPVLSLLHRRKARRRRGILNGSIEALAKPFKWSMGNSAMRSDRIKTERRELATIHGDGGSVLRGEEVPEREVDEAEAGEFQGD